MERKESSQNSGARSQNLASWSVAFLLFSAFILPPSSFAAVTYYVDGWLGNNSNGGLATTTLSLGHGPMRNITKAIAISLPGDTIQVAPGFYQETNWLPNGQNLVLPTSGTAYISDADPLVTSSAGDGLPDAWVAALNLNPFDSSVANLASSLSWANGTNNLAAYQISLIQPTITATITPTPNAAGWNHTNVVVHFSANSTGSGIAWVSSDITITGSTNNCAVTGWAMDNTGNITNLTVTVNTDQTVPAITLSPTDGAIITNSQPTLTATYSDNYSGIAAETIAMVLDDVDVTGSSTVTATQISYTPDTPLAVGRHTLAAGVSDQVGNSTAIASSFVVVPTGPTLLGWWQFDEADGTTAADSSVLGNTGILFNDPTWVSGVFGSALAFDTNQWVNVPASPVYDLTNAISVSLWVYSPRASGTGPATIFSKGDGVSDGWALGLNNDQAVTFAMTATNGNQLTAPVSLPTNAWTYVVASFDGTNATLYLNNALATNTIWSGERLLNTNGLVIGNASSNGIPIILDDVQLYNYALNTDEIAVPYTVDRDGDGLPDWWEVNNGLNPDDSSDASLTSTNPLAHGLTNLQVFQNSDIRGI